MASLSEDRLTPQFDIPEELTTDQSCDIEMPLDTPLPTPSPSPSISPVLPSADSSAYRPKLEPIPSQDQERDCTKEIVKKRKKRRVLKQSPILLESVASTAINRPLPPMESDSVINGPTSSTEMPPLLVPLHTPLDVTYEPIQLLSDDDISHLEQSTIGNPISSHGNRPHFLLKSDKAFFEKKDGRFAPVSKQETPAADPIPLSCPAISTISRVTLSRMCNYIFNTFGLAAYSLLTGFTICHTVFVFTLATLTTQDLNLVLNISRLSLAFNGLFSFLTSVSMVYIADRVDFPRMDRQYIREAIRNRKLNVLLNIIALFLTSLYLLLTLSLVHIDLQIHYFSMPASEGWNNLWPDLITNTTTTTTTTTPSCHSIIFSVGLQDYSPVNEPVSGRVALLKVFLLVRSVLCLCGWLIVVASPTQNRWFSFVNRAMREEI